MKKIHLPDWLNIFRKDQGKNSEFWAKPVWKVLGWLSMLLYPVFCMLTLEYFNQKALQPDIAYMARLKIQLTEYGLHMVFGLLVLYVLLAILLLLTKHAWISAGALGVLTLLCTYINYMKIMLNGNPFLPTDITLAGQAKELASFVHLKIPGLFWGFAAVLLVWCVLLALWRIRLPVRWMVRVPAALLAVVLVLFVFSDSNRSVRILNRFGMDIFDNVLQSSNYSANGFVAGFTLNAISMHISAPDDYSEEAVNAILEGYDGVEQAADAENFDVIVVLSESFFDLRELPGTTYSENVLQNYDAIRQEENCYSGLIYTIAHGGGTVNTEFRVLTGLNNDNLLPSGATPYNYISRDIDGFVSNYHNAGYNTVAVHLYNRNFYGRSRVFPLLGFDSFFDMQQANDNPDIIVQWTRGYATDASTERAIEYYLDQADENGQPTFLYAATIENHQAYLENEDNTVSVTVDNPEFAANETWMTALTTYAQGAKDADAMLGALKEYIDNRERPTVLVWFGDHLPTLGESYAPYDTLGYFNSTDYSVENRMKMFSTPFLVYANRELDQGLFTSKDSNQFSDSYLMECVAASTGFRQTPFMEYLGDTMSSLPIYNVELQMTDTLNDDQKKLANNWKLITYDRMLGKNYSADN